jgi:hypothetical protein
MFTAYNLRRLMNIIDKTTFRKFLQELAFLFSKIWASPMPIIAKISHSFFTPVTTDYFSDLPKALLKLNYI